MDNCIICLDDKDLISYKQCCKVLVHQNCIDRWNKISNNKCIICRKCDDNFIDYENVYNQPVEFNLNYEYEFTFEKLIIIILSFLILILNFGK